MSKAIYGVDIQVTHYMEIEAESQDEAEDIAIDQFEDTAGWWDDTDVDSWLIEELTDEDTEEEEEEDA